jgi:hypothetical protein
VGLLSECWKRIAEQEDCTQIAEIVQVKAARSFKCWRKLGDTEIFTSIINAQGFAKTVNPVQE